MPQGNNSIKSGSRHKPKHQNGFAFRHNPKSKLTEKILNSPNEHVCRRCYDKIEWRKQYRQYKPRTVLGKCNWCSRKSVKAAYHTICSECSLTHDKAKVLLKEWNEEKREKRNQKQSKDNTADADNEINDSEVVDTPPTNDDGDTVDGNNIIVDNKDATVDDNDDTVDDKDATVNADSLFDNDDDDKFLRVCCMCTKEPALPSPDDEPEDDLTTTTAKLSLRQRKTLERQQERQHRAKKEERRRARQLAKGLNDAADVTAENQDISSKSDADSDDNDSDLDSSDPLIQAVGGADKLLTGEAYQKQVLENTQQPETST